MRALIFILLFVLAPFHALANNTTLNDLLSTKQPQFLKVDEAFQVDFDQQGGTLFVGWDIAPGYYLYKEKLEFIAKGAQITPPDLPQGTDHEDEFFGKTQVYFDQLTTISKLKNITENAVVKVRYQGCAEAGLCYPPEIIEIPLTAYAQASGQTNTPSESQSATDREQKSANPAIADDSLTAKLLQQDIFTNLAIFFALGLTLAFTPCVFPMFPILSSLIAGQGQLSTKRAFSLSFVYVQGMAITYAMLGLVVAALGGQVQGYIQHPAVLISFSILFVVLALSMFGLYEFKLPQSWMTKLTQVSNQQKSGNYTGVFLMGVLSGLIASPCTTAPLSAALLYVAQSGDYFVGGITLYVLSLGMGVPLLLMGTSGGKLLPKAGAWMEQVKVIFGFVMLVVPLVLLERILDWQTIVLLGSALAMVTGIYLYYWQTLTTNNKAKTSLWFVALLLVLFGFNNIKESLSPTPVQTVAAVQTNTSNEFVFVKNLDELNIEIEKAAANNKLVMLDLYADWCVACKEFEHKTFPAPEVQSAFSDYVLIQADLTESNDVTISFMETYDVFGLPTILFFDRNGNELSSKRVTGFQKAEQFAAHLTAISKSHP